MVAMIEAAKESVMTPHASFLALQFAPQESLKNAELLKDQFQAYGPHGFLDAVDLQVGGRLRRRAFARSGDDHGRRCQRPRQRLHPKSVLRREGDRGAPTLDGLRAVQLRGRAGGELDRSRRPPRKSSLADGRPGSSLGAHPVTCPSTPGLCRTRLASPDGSAL